MADEAENVTRLAKSFEDALAETQKLRNDVVGVLETNATLRRTTLTSTALIVAVLILALALVPTVLSVNHIVAEIRSCSVPTGACAEQSASQYNDAVIAVTYRSEVERIKTQIQVSQATGNLAAIPAYQARLAEEQAVLDQLNTKATK